jgi:hypothetical protein
VLGHDGTRSRCAVENVGAIFDEALGRVLPAEHVLEHSFFGRDELPVRAVELPQDADLADVERILPAVEIDEHALIDFVEVERFTRHVLEVPRELSGVGTQRERRAGVERAVGTARAAARLHPRLRLSDAPIGEIQIRIVRAGDPGIAAGPAFRKIVQSRRRGPWRRAIDARLSARSVEAGDEAALIFVAACAFRSPMLAILR